jgi:flagellar protein FlbD
MSELLRTTVAEQDAGQNMAGRGGTQMIQLERMNGSELWLNPFHIETIEQTPDTVITLANGHRYIVRQRAEEVSLQMSVFWQHVGIAGAASGFTADQGNRMRAKGSD